VSVAVAFVGAGLGVKPRPVFGPAVRPHFLFPGFRACFSELLGISRTAPDRKTLPEVAPSVTPRAARQTQYFPVLQPPHLVIRFLQMDGRKNIRLAAKYYTGRGWYFLTACTRHRDRVFSNPTLAHFLIHAIRTAAALEDFRLHAWCVMPDHVHILAEGSTTESVLSRFISRWKRASALEFKRRFSRELWQRIFYDHVLRPMELPHTFAWYIWLNPVRKGMCKEPGEYPWSGSLTMEWTKIQRPADDWIPPWKRNGDPARPTCEAGNEIPYTGA
jgi:putative transposase